MRLFFFFCFALLGFFGCKSASGPEESLREYIDYAVSGDATKDGFMERSTSGLLTALEGMDQADFDDYAKEMAHVDKKRMKINNKNCQEDKCFITYTISYDGKSDEKSVYSIEVRKIAELHQIDEEWKLASINNVKSHYDGTSEITDEDFARENNGLTPDEAQSLREK